MRHGSLFSGIGGFDLAAEWMGWENVFHCEWMEFPRKVLDYHFPNADSHIDICKTDFTKYANTIDILTGGFPCQPFSLAGKRKGTDDERYLWGEMLRAIQEIKPTFVIAENVFGITNIDGGLVFQQVCLDLENEGYEVQPFIIPACAKNAPHRRDRCWFVAFNTKSHRSATIGKVCTRQDNESIGVCYDDRIATNTNCNDGRSTDRKGGCEESKANGEGQQSIHSRIGATSNEGDASNTNSIGCGGRSQQSKSNQSQEREICENEQQHRDGVRCEIEGCSWNVTNSNGNGFNERNGNDEINTGQGGQYALGDFESGNGNGDATDTTSTRPQARSQSRSKQHWQNDKKRGIFGWQSFPTQSPICGGDDGLPTKLDGITFSKWRNESIKGYGNAIVPQIAHQLFQIINDL